MELKNTYSAREVAALTGLSARQLQWWDDRRLFQSAVAPKPTAAGGFTERRYTPVDLLELMVLADLRRQGLTVSRIRQLLETLRTTFGIRLFDAIGGAGAFTLLTDGREVYAQIGAGRVLQSAAQPVAAAARARERASAASAHGQGSRRAGKRRSSKSRRTPKRAGREKEATTPRRPRRDLRRQPIGKILSSPSAGRGIT